MILGIGIDLVDIDRFKEWHTRPAQQLMRIFSQDEITYCQENHLKSAERFAARFAAKEAFYKAFCSWQPETNISLSIVCLAVRTTKNRYGMPQLSIDWHALNTPFHPTCFLSLSHSAMLAVAQVIITKQ